MANYLLVYHGGSRPQTEAEQAQVMAAWGTWYGELGDSVVDGGNPVGQARTVGKDGIVTAGGGANPATGYTVIKAANIDSAVEKSRGCPVLRGGGTVEVCETFDVM